MDSIPHWLERTELLLGGEPLRCLTGKHLLVVGLGGVGSKACELLARSGVRHFTIVDHDCVDETNINRQEIAFRDTIGHTKVEAMRELLLRINPDTQIETHASYLSGDNISTLLSAHRYDYILDCIDTLSPKCELILTAHQLGIPVISAMGAGAKVDPTRVSVAPMSRTHVCALSRFVRKRLRQLGAPHSVFAIPCVYSSEPSHERAILPLARSNQNKRSIVGSISYMPQLFAIHMVAFVLQALTTQSYTSLTLHAIPPCHP